MSKELIQILKDFQNKQPELLSMDAKTKIDKLGEVFKDVAKQLLNGGCFVVHSNGVEYRKVYLHTLEFYYHEEEGDLKDYIVYHRNKPTKLLPYFKLGTLNAHQSGIDITFESEDGKYRASALVRAFEVNGKIDTRSTYLYDQLFTDVPLPFSVEWKSEKREGNLYQGYRVNVHLYNKDEKPLKECPDDKPWAFSRADFPPKYRMKKQAD